MTAPAQLAYEGVLDPLNAGPDWAGSWSITFGFGKPAQNTYTEVAFTSDVAVQELPAHVLDEVVRRVAADLYGTAYAFTYPPEQYEQAVGRFGIRRRERVVVTSVDVWSS